MTNNGAAPEGFFVDPRLNASASVALAGLDATTGLTLPLIGNPPLWFVPSEASAVSVAQTASLPAMFDFGPNQGDPDLSSHNPGPGRGTLYVDDLVDNVPPYGQFTADELAGLGIPTRSSNAASRGDGHRPRETGETGVSRREAAWNRRG